MKTKIIILNTLLLSANCLIAMEASKKRRVDQTVITSTSVFKDMPDVITTAIMQYAVSGPKDINTYAQVCKAWKKEVGTPDCGLAQFLDKLKTGSKEVAFTLVVKAPMMPYIAQLYNKFDEDRQKLSDLDTDAIRKLQVKRSAHDTLLIKLAAQHNKLNVIQHLIARGAQVRAQKAQQVDPLCVALSNNSSLTAKFLMHNDTDFAQTRFIKTAHNDTLLHLAVRSGNTEQVRYLVEYIQQFPFANPTEFGQLCNIQNAEGNTILHEAVNKNNPELVTLCLGLHCDPRTTNNKNETALHKAVVINNQPMCRSILERVHQVFAPHFNAFCNAQDAQGETALYKSVAQNNSSIASFLVRQCRAQVTAGKLPIVKALENKNYDLFKLLLESEPLHARAARLNNCLVGAVQGAFDLDAIGFVIKQGAQVNQIITDTGKSLSHAVLNANNYNENYREQLVKLLLKSGANPAIVDSNGQNALHYCAELGSLSIMKLLLDYGVHNVAKADKAGTTPLQCALNNNKHQMADFITEQLKNT